MGALCDGEGRLILMVRGPPQVDRALTLTRVSSHVLSVDLEPNDPPVRALLSSPNTISLHESHRGWLRS